MRAAERLPAQRVSAEVRSLLEDNTDFPTSDGLRNGLREAQDDQRNSQLRRPVAPAAVQMHALKKPPPQLYDAPHMHPGTPFNPSAQQRARCDNCLCSDNELYEWPTAHAA